MKSRGQGCWPQSCRSCLKGPWTPLKRDCPPPPGEEEEEINKLVLEGADGTQPADSSHPLSCLIIIHSYMHSAWAKAEAYPMSIPANLQIT